MRALRRYVQAVQPHQRIVNFFDLKTNCCEFSAQLMVLGTGIALPIIFININQHFKHASNITQMDKLVPKLLAAAMQTRGVS